MVPLGDVAGKCPFCGKDWTAKVVFPSDGEAYPVQQGVALHMVVEHGSTHAQLRIEAEVACRRCKRDFRESWSIVPAAQSQGDQ